VQKYSANAVNVWSLLLIRVVVVEIPVSFQREK